MLPKSDHSHYTRAVDSGELMADHGWCLPPNPPNPGGFHAPDEADFVEQVEGLFARGDITIALRNEALSGRDRLNWSSGQLGPSEKNICDQVSGAWAELGEIAGLFATADWARRVEIGADQILLGKGAPLGSRLENYLWAVVARTSIYRFDGGKWIFIDSATFSLRDRIVRRLLGAVSAIGESPLGTARLWLPKVSPKCSSSRRCKPEIREFFNALRNLEKLTGLPDEITLSLKRRAVGLESENHSELVFSYRDSLLSRKA